MRENDERSAVDAPRRPSDGPPSGDPHRPGRVRRLRARVPAPLRTLGRALGLPLSEVGRYWFDERDAIRRGLGALGLGLIATLVAGIVLGSVTDRLEDTPGLLLLIPAAIGMRGANFGALASRLSTGIHTGEYEPELSRTNYLGRNVEAAAILTVVSTVQIGVLAWLLAALFGLPSIGLLDLVMISVVGGLLSSLVLLGMTIFVSRTASERGWNMDDVGAPAITATGDLVTVPTLLLASLLVDVPLVSAVLGIVAVVAGLWALWKGLQHAQPDVRRIVQESVVVLTFAALADILAGTVVETRAEQFFEEPALLVLIPPFIAGCGSLGGMLSSRLASKLHVGLLEPRVLPGKMAALDVSLVAVFATAVFTGVGAVTWLATNVTHAVGLTAAPPPALLALVGVALFGGALAFVLLSVTAYTAATATYRFGWDPDNHGIPIVTATMDLFGILCLVAAIAIFRM